MEKEEVLDKIRLWREKYKYVARSLIWVNNMALYPESLKLDDQNYLCLYEDDFPFGCIFIEFITDLEVEWTDERTDYMNQVTCGNCKKEIDLRKCPNYLCDTCIKEKKYWWNSKYMRKIK